MIKRNPPKPVDKWRAVIYAEEDYLANGTSYLSHTVYERETEMVDTGLLDINGNPIKRNGSPKGTIGFVKF
jgi:hypothetical protein